MPRVKSGDIQMNYTRQGAGDPLILIPYLAAENGCYAFQVADYAKQFDCISVDLRGTGESDKPEGTWSTEMFADDVASLMEALGIEKAHIWGVSLGGATGMWLAAKHPGKVKSLSLHSTWPASDPYLKAVVAGWQLIARQLDDMPETVIQALFPWCFTPQLYASKPDYIRTLADFVRSRPRQPLEAFLRQSEAAIAHDAAGELRKIVAPTQITFGRHDQVCSTRFAEPLRQGIAKSELHVFEDCSHAGLYENVPAFNEVTLGFLRKHAG